MAYRYSNTRVSKGVVLSVLAFWLVVAVLLMSMISGLYWHYQLGKSIDKYVFEHQCVQIENTDLWRCDDGIIEL